MPSIDIRLQECEHRIKNHLQLIASALALQARDSDDTQVTLALMQACGCVSAVARLHARLQDLDQTEFVDIAPFLSNLCSDLCSCLSSTGVRRVPLEVEADDGLMSVTRALPVSLMVNELVTNAVKHGAAIAGKPIRVRLAREATAWQLTVADQGPGMDPELFQSAASGLGHRLLQTLVKEIGGALSVESSSLGTTVSVRFNRMQAH